MGTRIVPEPKNVISPPPFWRSFCRFGEIFDTLRVVEIGPATRAKKKEKKQKKETEIQKDAFKTPFAASLPKVELPCPSRNTKT